ncbi:MAG TPA: thiamine-phosphate kinase [Caballeronia sp.]|jgi:thiamine-monophosphate kinase|nr:thiamine-monophosphate kinase [Caballeronia sp.]HEV7832870.1 thiamine-phosphate kinase [Caballeronia sp.]
MLSEFSLIERYFSQPAATFPATADEPNATLGIGDDCALLASKPGEHLAISTDMLVSGRHFFPDVSPWSLGYKALAVNLSDLAAMGAKPRAFTLALSMPKADESWLEAFSSGLFQMANRYGCELIGGDTTSGPNVTISITVFGDVPAAQALRRDAARPGDDIWVSGVLGGARAGLGVRRGEWALNNAASEAIAIKALEQPEPRVALGIALRGVAHAALDISDGLAGDLLHILKRSKMQASVNIDQIPRSGTLATLPETAQVHCVLAGGDDYELCFTAPVAVRSEIERIGTAQKVLLTRIGTIEGRTASGASSERPEPPAIDWRDNTGPVSFQDTGFDHFHAD